MSVVKKDGRKDSAPSDDAVEGIMPDLPKKTVAVDLPEDALDPV